MLQILTKDSVTVFVNAIMFYKVKDPISAVANVDDYSASARLLSATTLRNVLGTKSLKEILSERETIARDMQVASHSVTCHVTPCPPRRSCCTRPRSPGVSTWSAWR